MTPVDIDNLKQRVQEAEALPEAERLAALGALAAVTFPSLLEELQARRNPPPLNTVHLEGLSNRERQISVMLASGNRTQEVAKALDISPHTVRNHLKSIFRKLQIDSQRDLALLVRLGKK